MNATIKVGDREMTVAEAREFYKALREVFADKTGLSPLDTIKEWTKRQDEDAKRIAGRENEKWPRMNPRSPWGSPFVYLGGAGAEFAPKPWGQYGIHNGVAV